MKTILIIFVLILPIIAESFAQNVSDELTDEQICGEGNILVNGICTPKSIWDASDFRGLQTGETILNSEVAIIIQSLGAILIVSFIVCFENPVLRDCVVARFSEVFTFATIWFYRV